MEPTGKTPTQSKTVQGTVVALVAYLTTVLVDVQPYVLEIINSLMALGVSWAVYGLRDVLERFQTKK